MWIHKLHDIIYRAYQMINDHNIASEVQLTEGEPLTKGGSNFNGIIL